MLVRCAMNMRRQLGAECSLYVPPVPPGHALVSATCTPTPCSAMRYSSSLRYSTAPGDRVEYSPGTMSLRSRRGGAACSQRHDPGPPADQQHVPRRIAPQTKYPPIVPRSFESSRPPDSSRPVGRDPPSSRRSIVQKRCASRVRTRSVAALRLIAVLAVSDIDVLARRGGRSKFRRSRRGLLQRWVSSTSSTTLANCQSLNPR